MSRISRVQKQNVNKPVRRQEASPRLWQLHCALTMISKGFLGRKIHRFRYPLHLEKRKQKCKQANVVNYFGSYWRLASPAPEDLVHLLKMPSFQKRIHWLNGLHIARYALCHRQKLSEPVLCSDGISGCWHCQRDRYIAAELDRNACPKWELYDQLMLSLGLAVPSLIWTPPKSHLYAPYTSSKVCNSATQVVLKAQQNVNKPIRNTQCLCLPLRLDMILLVCWRNLLVWDLSLWAYSARDIFVEDTTDGADAVAGVEGTEKVPISPLAPTVMLLFCCPELEIMGGFRVKLSFEAVWHELDAAAEAESASTRSCKEFVYILYGGFVYILPARLCFLHTRARTRARSGRTARIIWPARREEASWV